MSAETLKKFILGALIILGALSVSARAEKFFDIAQRQFLDKDRKAALLTLKRGAELSTKQKEKDQALSLAREMAAMFLTDKGQKLFEAAQALMFSRPSEAKARLLEARDLEAQNVSIEVALARAHAAQEECSASVKILAEIEELAFASQEWWDLSVYALICAEKSEELETFLEKKFLNIRPQAFGQKMATAALAEAKGENEKALKLYGELTKMDRQHPLGWRGLFNIKRELQQPALEEAKAYLKICEGQGKALQQKILNTPGICLHTRAPEAYVRAQAKESAGE